MRVNFLSIHAKLEIHRVWMEEEDEEAGDMSLSNLKVPRVARNIDEDVESKKEVRKLRIMNLSKFAF